MIYARRNDEEEDGMRMHLGCIVNLRAFVHASLANRESALAKLLLKLVLLLDFRASSAGYRLEVE